MKIWSLLGFALGALVSSHAWSTGFDIPGPLDIPNPPRIIDSCNRGDLEHWLQKMKEGRILFGAHEEPTLMNFGRKLMDVDADINGTQKLLEIVRVLSQKTAAELAQDPRILNEWKTVMITRVASLFITRPGNRTGEIGGNNRGTLPELAQAIANTDRGAAWCAAFTAMSVALTDCALQESFKELLTPFTDQIRTEIEQKIANPSTSTEARNQLIDQQHILEENLWLFSEPGISAGIRQTQSWYFGAVNNAFVASLVDEASRAHRLITDPKRCEPGMAIAWVNMSSRSRQGHMGLVRDVKRTRNNGVILRTVEANTSASGSDDNERVGGATAGVYPKKYGPRSFGLSGSRKTFQGCIDLF